MEISANMNLDQLAERMGTVATRENAEVMRGLLVGRFDGQDTSEIPEADWLSMLDEAARA